MTTRPAEGDPRTLDAATVGAAWLAVAGQILADGVASRYDGLPVREISHVTLRVERPDPDDEIIARFAEPERLAWMHANFTDRTRVAGPRRGGQLRDAAVRLRALRARPGGLGHRPAARGSGQPFGRHHDLPAAYRQQLHPVRQPAGLLAAGRGGGAGRLRAQHRLRRQGVRQPGRARLAAASRRRRAGGAGRAAADDRQVGARVRDGVRVRARRADPGREAVTATPTARRGRRRPRAPACLCPRPWPGGGPPSGTGRGPGAGGGRWSRRPSGCRCGSG